MDIKKAIEILSYHQEWRTGEKEWMIYSPSELTEALAVALWELKKLKKSAHQKS